MIIIITKPNNTVIITDNIIPSTTPNIYCNNLIFLADKYLYRILGLVNNIDLYMKDNINIMPRIYFKVIINLYFFYNHLH